jgi:outer membrane biosynthesis protein TonB
MKQTKKMKKITFLALMVSLMTVHSTMASEGNEGSLKKAIRKNLNYPTFAKETKLHGFVLVEFEVKSNGNIVVKEMNASHPELADHVESVLEGVQLTDVSSIGTHFIKFNFKYVDL